MEEDEEISLPENVVVLEAENGSKVYLVGTAHFSEKSERDVIQTIRKVQPSSVVLELCKGRFHVVCYDEEKICKEINSLNFSKITRIIKEGGFMHGLITILFLQGTAHIINKLGMAPGREFRSAYNEAIKIPGCVVHLGDRPLEITLSRLISSLPLWKKIRLIYLILTCDKSVTPEQLEKFKEKSVLEEALKEFALQVPEMNRVFVDERNTYLAYSLRLAACPVPSFENPGKFVPINVVGVVGIGHLKGIVDKWKNEITGSDIAKLLEIPKPSATSLFVSYISKYFFLSLFIWGFYKYFIPKTIREVISSIRCRVWKLIVDKFYYQA